MKILQKLFKLKNLCCILLMMIVFIPNFTTLGYGNTPSNNVTVFIDGKQLHEPGVIENGRTLLPFRAMLEALEAKVHWESDTRTIIAVKGKTAIKLRLGDKYAYFNGDDENKVPLDVAPKTISNRTYVPARFIAESLGANIEWNAKDKVVYISDKLKSSDSKKSNYYGNSIGNFSNNSPFTKQGDWVYFAEDKGKFGLYKMKIDGTDKILISEDYVSQIDSINVKGDWIYYISGSDEIYKIKTDGTYRTNLSEKVVRKPIQGGGITFRVENKYDYLRVAGEWIYYYDSDYGIHKMKTDGTSDTKISNDKPSAMYVVGEYIYFTDSTGLMYRMKTDGSSKVKLSDDLCKMFNVVDGWIYYIFNDLDAPFNQSYSIFKMEVNGANRQKINTPLADESRTNIESIHVVDNWIYFTLRGRGDSTNKTTSLYKINTDGSSETMLNYNWPQGQKIFIIDNKIYFNGKFVDM